MPRRLVLALGATLLTFASACGSPGTDAPAAPKKDPSSIETDFASAKTDFYFYGESDFPLAQALADEFQKQFPNIDVEFKGDSAQNLVVNSPRILSSEEPPDLLQIPSLSAVKDGLVTNLDPYFDVYKWDAFPPDTFTSHRADSDGIVGEGSLYAGGLSSGMTGVYWNTKLAEQLGISEAPATLDELEADMQLAKDAGVLPIMTAAKGGEINWLWQGVLNQYWTPDQTRAWGWNHPDATLLDDEARGATERVVRWIEDGYLPSDANAIDYTNMLGRFKAGEGLFCFLGTWEAAGLQADMGDDVDFMLVPPLEEGGIHSGMGGSNHYSIPAGAKNPDVAAFFLNWAMTNEEARQLTVDLTGMSPIGPPPTDVTASGPVVQEGLDALQAVSADDGTTPFVVDAADGLFTNTFTPAFQDLIAGRVSVEEFLTRIQDDYEASQG